MQNCRLGQTRGQQMYALIEDLFPLCRSITGDGLRSSLEQIRSVIPLHMTEVPTGTQVFDWTVPNEWNVREAYLEDMSGRRILDFSQNNLHLLGYSLPFRGKVSLQELQEHLHSLPEQPEAIPYVTSYYEPRWGFCLSHNQRQSLQAEAYYVHIDTELFDGSMTLADWVLPGETQQEILISTYLCHPSMANNELSGPVLAAFLARELSQWQRRRYTYRFLFIPETIGAIAYLSQHLAHLKTWVAAGLVVTCVGDPGPHSYLTTREGSALIDRVVQHVLRYSKRETRIYSWLERGSDERQYNWPGVDLPVGVLMRSKYGTYPEYHTSLDNLDFVTPEALEESLELYLRCLSALEANRCYRSTSLGEPQLSRRGLYPTLATRDAGRTTRDLVNLLAYSDGQTDLVQIAESIGVPVWELSDWIPRLLQENLLVLAE